MIEDPKDGEPRPPAAKKPFEPPRLVEYGNLATVTRTVGSLGARDGGVGNRKGTEL